jgi:hypothetical protein
VALAYSLAATLGFIVAVPGVGLSAPAVVLVSFLPMLCIAFAYDYMNRADPDAGHVVRLGHARDGPAARRPTASRYS